MPILGMRPSSAILLGVLLMAGLDGPLVAESSDSGAVATTTSVLPPYKSSEYSNVKPKGTSTPYFSHGYLIQWKHFGVAPESNVYLYNSSGKLQYTVSVWPEGATRLLLTSVDVGAGGRLAFAGQQTKGDDKAPFIATANLDGTNAHYFNTSEFIPTRIAVADDGSVWAVGAERSEMNGGQQTWKNYDVLRHYGADGMLLEHFLSRWGKGASYVRTVVDDAGRPWLDAYDDSGKVIKTFGAPLWGDTGGYANAWRSDYPIGLSATNGKVVLYDESTARLFTYEAAKNISTQCDVQLPVEHSMVLTGFASLGDGEVFASFKSKHGVESGLFKAVCDPKSGFGVWTAVAGTSGATVDSGSFERLLGTSDDDLVYRSADDSNVSGVKIFWSHVQ